MLACSAVAISAGVTHVATRFTKLRLCPWTLFVKTDDYSFSSSDSVRGGPLRQRYWNGQRTVTFAEVPYATARNSTGSPSKPPTCGYASLDLASTEFGMRVDGFCRFGCSPWGVVTVLLPADGCSRTDVPADHHVEQNPVQQRLILYGGGYAGRLTPVADETRDEVARGTDCDHEGCNGGWVLPLSFVRGGATQARFNIDHAMRSLSHVGPAIYNPPVILTPVDATHAPVCGLQCAKEWMVSTMTRGMGADERFFEGPDGQRYLASAWHPPTQERQ